VSEVITMRKLFVSIVLLMLPACGVAEHKTFEDPGTPKSQAPIPDGVELTFATIKSLIIDKKCAKCHDGFEASSFDTREKLLSKPKRITPGNPGKSHFYTVLVKGSMPKNAPRLPDREIELVRQWIAAGAL
jgi:hypothetical protein